MEMNAPTLMPRAHSAPRLHRHLYWAALAIILTGAQPIASMHALRAQTVTNRFAPARERLEESAVYGPSGHQGQGADLRRRDNDSTSSTRLPHRPAESTVVAASGDGWKTARITAYSLAAVALGVLVFALVAIRAD